MVKGIICEDMDYFGVRSQNLCEEVIKNGFWEWEIMFVMLSDGMVVVIDDGLCVGVIYDAVL